MKKVVLAAAALVAMPVASVTTALGAQGFSPVAGTQVPAAPPFSTTATAVVVILAVVASIGFLCTVVTCRRLQSANAARTAIEDASRALGARDMSTRDFGQQDGMRSPNDLYVPLNA